MAAIRYAARRPGAAARWVKIGVSLRPTTTGHGHPSVHARAGTIAYCESQNVKGDAAK